MGYNCVLVADLQMGKLGKRRLSNLPKVTKLRIFMPAGGRS